MNQADLEMNAANFRAFRIQYFIPGTIWYFQEQMELFQVSDGCTKISKDSRTEVLFTWGQMRAYNHHKQQSRSLGHVICMLQTLTLQKVLSLTEVSLQRDPHLFDVTENHMSLEFPLGSDLRSNFCSFIPERLAFCPSGPAQAHPDLPSACGSALFPALLEGFLFPYSSSLPVGSCFPRSFSLVPPFFSPLHSVSLLAAAVPSQLHASWHTQLFHKSFKEGRI